MSTEEKWRNNESPAQKSGHRKWNDERVGFGARPTLTNHKKHGETISSYRQNWQNPAKNPKPWSVVQYRKWSPTANDPQNGPQMILDRKWSPKSTANDPVKTWGMEWILWDWLQKRTDYKKGTFSRAF